ncbi:sulfate adenylyltransferase small subunit, partial [Streptomyces flaveolus]
MTTTVATVKEGEGSASSPYALSHLDALESEAVHIFREVAGEFERPVILFSGGKDSIL